MAIQTESCRRSPPSTTVTGFLKPALKRSADFVDRFMRGRDTRCIDYGDASTFSNV